jgi:hypothetical protein
MKTSGDPGLLAMRLRRKRKHKLEESMRRDGAVRRHGHFHPLRAVAARGRRIELDLELEVEPLGIGFHHTLKVRQRLVRVVLGLDGEAGGAPFGVSSALNNLR